MSPGDPYEDCPTGNPNTALADCWKPEVTAPVSDSMIERVAKAIEGANITSSDGSHSMKFSTPWEIADNYRRIARAAIEAMREPTEKMVDTGNECCDYFKHARQTWGAMIDAALSEKP